MDRLDTLELPSLSSMCDGMGGSMLGSRLKLEFIFFGLFFFLYLVLFTSLFLFSLY